MKNKLTDIAIYVFVGACTVYFAYLAVEQLAK